VADHPEDVMKARLAERQLRKTIADGISRLIDGYPDGSVDVINALLDAEIVALGGEVGRG